MWPRLNMVPFDSRSPFQTSGVRIGTPAVTSRGFVEKDMEDIVDLIDAVLTSAAEHIDAITAKGERTDEQKNSLAEHQSVLDEVKRKVHMMTGGRPLNRY